MKTLAVSLITGTLLGFAVPVCIADEAGKVSFKKITLDRAFRSEGVAVGDFDGDGKLDIAAGDVFFAAPDWKMNRIAAQPKSYNPLSGRAGAYLCFAGDVNRDGHTDVIHMCRPGGPVLWFENPGTARPWKKHVAVRMYTTESPHWASVRGQEKELVLGYPVDQDDFESPKRRMAFVRPGKDPTALWPVRMFSANGGSGSRRWHHGLGVGDINGDGRKDVVTPQGWYESPADKKKSEWTFHKANLGKDCAQMLIYDFDGDGDNDVLSTSAHKFGIWWHEQMPAGWRTHLIDKSFSQSHAACLADINGDGLPDLVTGRRYWAHMGRDPGAKMPAVLVWFELKRRKGRPMWTKHLIDNDSGVGIQFEVVDVNGDGLLDVATSNKKGVYYFEQVRDAGN